MAKEKRFELIYTQGTVDIIRVIQDNLTGMQYLQVVNGYAGGLTPLLGRDGAPMAWDTPDVEAQKA